MSLHGPIRGWLGAFGLGDCIVPSLCPSHHLVQQSFCWADSLSSQTHTNEARIGALKHRSLLQQLWSEQPDNEPAFPGLPLQISLQRTLEEKFPPGFSFLWPGISGVAGHHECQTSTRPLLA